MSPETLTKPEQSSEYLSREELHQLTDRANVRPEMRASAHSNIDRFGEMMRVTDGPGFTSALEEFSSNKDRGQEIVAAEARNAANPSELYDFYEAHWQNFPPEDGGDYTHLKIALQGIIQKRTAPKKDPVTSQGRRPKRSHEVTDEILTREDSIDDQVDQPQAPAAKRLIAPPRVTRPTEQRTPADQPRHRLRHRLSRALTANRAQERPIETRLALLSVLLREEDLTDRAEQLLRETNQFNVAPEIILTPEQPPPLEALAPTERTRLIPELPVGDQRESQERLRLHHRDEEAVTQHRTEMTAAIGELIEAAPFERLSIVPDDDREASTALILSVALESDHRVRLIGDQEIDTEALTLFDENDTARLFTRSESEGVLALAPIAEPPAEFARLEALQAEPTLELSKPTDEDEGYEHGLSSELYRLSGDHPADPDLYPDYPVLGEALRQDDAGARPARPDGADPLALPENPAADGWNRLFADPCLIRDSVPPELPPQPDRLTADADEETLLPPELADPTDGPATDVPTEAEVVEPRLVAATTVEATAAENEYRQTTIPSRIIDLYDFLHR